MRITFWLIVVITTVLAFLGWSEGVWRYHSFENVPGQLVFGWYQDQFYLSAAVGIATGFLWAIKSRRRVLHEPRDTGEKYLSRVLIHGLKGMALGGLVVFVMALARAASFIDIPVDWNVRIFQLVFTRKCLGVMCAVAPMMGLSWGVSIRLIHGDWGGSRALIPDGRGG